MSESDQSLEHRLPAQRDDLSGLPSRAAFRERMHDALQRAARSGTGLALLLINLDDFRSVNDSQGQDGGDRLLRDIAARLQALVRGGELVARLGADEFAFVCEQVSDPADMAALAERIAAALRRVPAAAEAGDGAAASPTCVSASIGIATARAGADSFDDMMRYAGIALQSVREAGGDAWRFFDRAVHAQALRRAGLVDGLRMALARKEMSPRFQPIVAADSGRIVGAELLLRWFPAGGEVSPAEFIPVAESTGAIAAIGAWVFEQACLAERDWHGRWGAQAPYVSVNVSVRQLNDDTLDQTFAQILSDTGADASRLLLEVTESMLMHDIEAKLRLMHRLAAMGLRVAIDDFGTGYSSLAQLTRLPVDVLKIDRSFVQGIAHSGDSRAVVEAVIGLGRSLGLKLLAEGVETREQQLELCAYGCDYIQGYYFYRPLTQDAFVEAVGRQADEAAPDAAGGMYFLLYVSEATRAPSAADMEHLLRVARANNEPVGVTGCLMLQDGHFMQMLEGERGAVLDTFARIRDNPGHKGVRIVAEGKARRRVFTHWSMLLQDGSTERHGADFGAWQKDTLSFEALAGDARACYAYMTAFVPDLKH